MQSFSYKVKSELCRTAGQPSVLRAGGGLWRAAVLQHVHADAGAHYHGKTPSFPRALPRLFQRAFSVKFDRLPEDDGGHGKLVFQITDPEKLDPDHQPARL